MDQLPFDTPKNRGGGDTRTPKAKVDIAKRENQIVALWLRKNLVRGHAVSLFISLFFLWGLSNELTRISVVRVGRTASPECEL